MAEPEEPVEVLSGTADGGLRWVVVTAGTDQDLYTMLNVYQGDHLVGGSGFGGPKLYPGSVMNEWRGQRGDLPWFVMARTAPEVDRVVATTSRGTEIVLAISPLVARFGLRFAAAALPAGDWPGGLRAECAGTVLEDRPNAGPPRRPPGLAR